MNSHPAPSSITWRKSSRSASGAGANCIEVAANGQAIAIRDSTQATEDFKTLATSAADWSGLIATIKTGHLD